MKTAVISYSFTGNNEALAKSVADALAAEHIKITEAKHRTMGTIMLDMLLNRTPKVQPLPDRLEKYERILFVAPIWLGQIASPLRPYLKYLKAHPRKYAFISISGGAINMNSKLEGELLKITGEQPFALIDQHIADLLPREPKPTTQETSAYKVTSSDIKKLTDAIMKTAGEKLSAAE